MKIKKQDQFKELIESLLLIKQQEFRNEEGVLSLRTSVQFMKAKEAIYHNLRFFEEDNIEVRILNHDNLTYDLTIQFISNKDDARFIIFALDYFATTLTVSELKFNTIKQFEVINIKTVLS